MGSIISRPRENQDVEKNNLFARIDSIIIDSRYKETPDICHKIKTHILKNQEEYEPILNFLEVLSSLANEENMIWLKALRACSIEFIIHTIDHTDGKGHLNIVKFWFEKECNEYNKEFDKMAEFARALYTAYCGDRIINSILSSAMEEMDNIKRNNSVNATITASSSSSNHGPTISHQNMNCNSLEFDDSLRR